MDKIEIDLYVKGNILVKGDVIAKRRRQGNAVVDSCYCYVNEQNTMLDFSKATVVHGDLIVDNLDTRNKVTAATGDIILLDSSTLGTQG